MQKNKTYFYCDNCRDIVIHVLTGFDMEMLPRKSSIWKMLLALVK